MNKKDAKINSKLSKALQDARYLGHYKLERISSAQMNDMIVRGLKATEYNWEIEIKIPSDNKFDAELNKKLELVLQRAIEKASLEEINATYKETTEKMEHIWLDRTTYLKIVEALKNNDEVVIEAAQEQPFLIGRGCKNKTTFKIKEN
jgi:hypothetical protein